MTPDAVPLTRAGSRTSRRWNTYVWRVVWTPPGGRAPQIGVDDPVRGDGVAGFEQQTGENGALTLPAERQLLPPTPRLERAEHPQIQGGGEPVVTSVPLSVHAAPSVSAPSGEYRRDASQNGVIAGQRPNRHASKASLERGVQAGYKAFPRAPPWAVPTSLDDRRRATPTGAAMFAIARHPRRYFAAVLTLVAWVAASVVVSATSAAAKVGPNDTAGFVTPTRTVTVATVDWSQLAITAVAAAAIGVAATLAIQLVVHRAHRHSMAHA